MKRIIYTITLTAAVLGMTSCGENFLYKDPQGSFSGDMLENAQGVELLTTNAYANLTENGWGATPFNWYSAVLSAVMPTKARLPATNPLSTK